MGSIDIDTIEHASQEPMLQLMEERMKKYDAERDKRLRPDGNAQYVFLDRTEDPQMRAFSDDPWLNERSDLITLEDSQHVQHLILGAGIGGLLAGINFIRAGVDPKDIYLVDYAGGFGGAWYWNRYPGVTCDIESYTYLPELQHTGYMPKHNFSYGCEIRPYLESLATRHGLDRNAMFRSTIQSAEWNDTTKRWKIVISKQTTNGPPRVIAVHARFFSHFSGVHVHQKIPDLPGIASFKGEQFHIARWNYAVTGGNPDEPTPELSKLHDKRVAIVGTGASGIQAIPEVAKHAKHLIAVQRTPAGVDFREQRPTDPEEWAEITRDADWWEKRQRNMADILGGTLKDGEKKLIDDYTVTVTTYRAIFGGRDVGMTMDRIPGYVKELNAEDLPRMERIRKRVRDTVKDPETAEKLMPWHTSWCKRPVFHDYYLETFNRGNVELVADERGVTAVTPRGFVVGGKEYEVDVIIWATGYRGPFGTLVEERSNMKIVGRGGRRLDEKWRENVGTLYGVMTRGFPNLFLMGVFQSGVTLTWTSNMELMGGLHAYIAAEAVKKAGDGRDVSVEPTAEAEEEWSMEVLKRRGAGAALGGCTPNYFNMEGELDRLPMEVKIKMARGAVWGGGFGDFVERVGEWRAEGRLRGLDVDVV